MFNMVGIPECSMRSEAYVFFNGFLLAPSELSNRFPSLLLALLQTGRSEAVYCFIDKDGFIPIVKSVIWLLKDTNAQYTIGLHLVMAFQPD